MEAVTSIIDSPLVKLFFVMLQVFVFVFWLALVGWTYRDAKRRNSSSMYWAAVVLFFNVFGWLIYMMLRPPETLDDIKERELEVRVKQTEIRNSSFNCPACRKSVEKDFLICPHCRKKLKNVCASCKKPLNLGWTICPYCKTPV